MGKELFRDYIARKEQSHPVITSETEKVFKVDGYDRPFLDAYIKLSSEIMRGNMTVGEFNRIQDQIRADFIGPVPLSCRPVARAPWEREWVSYEVAHLGRRQESYL